jgi:hypothetical protein
MIVKPSIAFNDFAGTAKDVTARNVNGRNILSHRAQHSKIVTPAQAVTRNKLSKISRAYKQLSDSQITAWEVLASHLKGASSLGQSATLTAHNAFVRINSNRAMLGLPLLEDAPVYKAEVPAVAYEELWVYSDVVIFTGLEVPSDSYRLVVKMSTAQSPGTSSGWSKTVVVAPGILPDWGDADITALYTDTFGITPVAGQKYYLECWFLDVNTGFTGESLKVSSLCKSGPAQYVPRVQFKEVRYEGGANEGYIEELDFELIPGSVIVSNNMKVHCTGFSSGVVMHFAKYPKNMINACRCLHPVRSLDGKYRVMLIENYISLDKYRGYVQVTTSARGGQMGIRHYEIFSTALAGN